MSGMERNGSDWRMEFSATGLLYLMEVSVLFGELFAAYLLI